MTTFQKSRGDDAPIEVEEAQRRVLEEVSFLGLEDIDITEASGRVLGETLAAERDVPYSDNTAVDGYALRSADVATATSETPVRLRVALDLPAGRVSAESLAAGFAARIMTGAAIPSGADAVVMVEDTDAGSEAVTVFKGVAAGANVRRRGEDLAAGSEVLRSGMPIGAGEIGVLATIRRRVVRAGRRPIVAILSTGDEVVDFDDEMTPASVPNSNAWALAALVRESGGVPRIRGIVRDRRDETIQAIASAQPGSDFILSTGGVSAGALDFVKDALDALGAETKFWKVAMKPGKPVVFSRLTSGTLFFGLPGNPVSCMVAFHLFVAPSLRKAMGQTSSLVSPIVLTKLMAPVVSRGDRRTYIRVRVVAKEGELHSIPMRAQGSGATSSMVGANGLAIVEPGIESLEAGNRVPTHLIGPVTDESSPG